MPEWRAVPSFPWLEASSDGKIRRCEASIDGRRLPGIEIVGAKNKRGYVMLTIQFGRIRKTNFGKHVLICEAFHGPRPSPNHEVAHNDGVPGHNAPTNLRWVTPKENAADRRAHGRDRVGMQIHTAKLSDEDVIEIKCLKRLGFTGYGIAAMYSIDRNHANKIAAGKAWTHLTHPNDWFVLGALSNGA